MVDKVTMLTVEEFVRRYDKERPFEIIEGRIKPLPLTLAGQAACRSNILLGLLQHVKGNSSGQVYVRVPIVLTDDAQLVREARVPDVTYISAKRFAEYQQAEPDWRNKPLMIMPDLAVEIISGNDSYTDVRNKAEGYLHDGVRLVWVIDPRKRDVTVWRAGSKQQTTLTAEDSLDGEAVIPGFRMAVVELFD